MAEIYPRLVPCISAGLPRSRCEDNQLGTGQGTTVARKPGRQRIEHSVQMH